MTRSEEVGLIEATLVNLEQELAAAGEQPVVTRRILSVFHLNAARRRRRALETWGRLTDALEEARDEAAELLKLVD